MLLFQHQNPGISIPSNFLIAVDISGIHFVEKSSQVPNFNIFSFLFFFFFFFLFIYLFIFYFIFVRLLLLSHTEILAIFCVHAIGTVQSNFAFPPSFLGQRKQVTWGPDLRGPPHHGIDAWLPRHPPCHHEVRTRDEGLPRYRKKNIKKRK